MLGWDGTGPLGRGPLTSRGLVRAAEVMPAGGGGRGR